MTDWNSTPILIVEDQLEVGAVLRRALQNLGYGEVEIVSDGERALEQLRLKRFGLVMADLMMQPMSGLELIQIIRKEKKFGDIPIIAVSGAGVADTVAAAKLAGATSFILKPYNMATLRSKLTAALGEESAPVSGGQRARITGA
jgi:two-component system chemotaxis response regulator CheY